MIAITRSATASTTPGCGLTLVAVPEATDAPGASYEYAVDAFYVYNYYTGIGWVRRPHEEFDVPIDYDDPATDLQTVVTSLYKDTYYEALGAWRRELHEVFAA